MGVKLIWRGSYCGGIVIGLALVLHVACGNKPAADILSCPDDTISKPVTYKSNIEPLLKSKCAACHTESPKLFNRNNSPLDLNYDTYEHSKQNGERGLLTVMNGSMPKAPYTKLTSAQICDYFNWYTNGMPEQ